MTTPSVSPAIAEPADVRAPRAVHPIWIVRHAATRWTGVRWAGRTDLGLSVSGRWEARRLAARLVERLSAETAVTVVSSPARRARETAEILASSVLAGATGEARPSPVVAFEQDLLEADLGAADGLTWSELERSHPEVAAAILGGADVVDWPGGESAADLSARAARAWSSLEARSEAAAVVAVTHAALVRALLRHLAGAVDELAQRDLPPGSALALVPQGREWRIAARILGA